MNTAELLKELSDKTKELLSAAEAFRSLPDDALNAKASPESWSALECLEHLNRYGLFYLPEIGKRMAGSRHRNSSEFLPGLFGNYFAKSMIPGERMRKMKTFRDKDPNGSSLDKAVVNEFIRQQYSMLQLLNDAENIDLTKTRTSISISPWIKLRLGDTFRFVIYHNWRHMVQANRALIMAVKSSENGQAA